MAHELRVLVVEVDKIVDFGRLERIRSLVLKIERCWILEVDIPANSAFDGQEIAAEDGRPGPVSFLDFIIQTAAINSAARTEYWGSYSVATASVVTTP